MLFGVEMLDTDFDCAAPVELLYLNLNLMTIFNERRKDD